MREGLEGPQVGKQKPALIGKEKNNQENNKKKVVQLY